MFPILEARLFLAQKVPYFELKEANRWVAGNARVCKAAVRLTLPGTQLRTEGRCS